MPPEPVIHHDERAPGWVMLLVWVVFPGWVWIMAACGAVWLARLLLDLLTN
jgi:hypothetical protein